MQERRYDLDWLRISAFALLILYHIGMFYVTWDWHVKSSRAGPAIEPLMMLTSPWRLLLLFLISGAATRFMADKLSSGRLTLSRIGRLVPPLLLAVFVVVPPQSYYEVREVIEQGAPLSLDNFYLRYIAASGRWCDADGCLVTPTYNHMWFVAYLAVYTLLVIALAPWLRRAPHGIRLLLSGPGLFLTPWLYLWAARSILLPLFGVTHMLIDDWYAHAVSFAAFLLGFAIARDDAFFQGCARSRFAALALALACWASMIIVYAFVSAGRTDWDIALRAIRELQAWTAIIAAIGFAYRHLRTADCPVRRMLTRIVFPSYLIHQTIIVVAGHHLDEIGLPIWVEAPLLLGVTLLGCWLFYLMGSQLGPLRVWIGLPPRG